jgi:5-methylcytosine-specific restriction endonuclease McrA
MVGAARCRTSSDGQHKVKRGTYWCDICGIVPRSVMEPGPDEVPARRKPKNRRKPAPTLRAEVIERDEGRCRFCGSQCSDDWPMDRLTIDHLLPTSRGGKNELENLVVACWQCNHRKGDRTPEEAFMFVLAPGTLVVFPRHRRQV